MSRRIWMPLCLLGLIAGFQNCSKVAVADMEAAKAQTLENTPIFPQDIDTPVVDVGGEPPVTTQPPVVTNPPVTTTPSTPATTTPVDVVPVRAIAHCSDKKTNALNDNVMNARTLEMQLVKRSLSGYGKKKRKVISQELVCKDNNTVRIRENLKQGKIMFEGCKVADGDYQIRLIDQAGKDLVVDDAGIKLQKGMPKANQGVEVLMDSNPKATYALNAGLMDYAGTDCEVNASPLYIDLRRNAGDTDILSAPWSGVLFDIMGAKAFPVAHQPYRISWFERGRFALLALPNSAGKVTGIDQLFGNNTEGADSQFADNGFAALAKYDKNGDNMIDAKDEVFKKLRLWLDDNRNGVAEASELKSLASENIQSIDLDFDDQFYEQDRYGNEIKYKSVVRRSDGSRKPIFDVWFVLKY